MQKRYKQKYNIIALNKKYNILKWNKRKLYTQSKGACKYYISTLGGLKEMLILLMWLGGVQRQNAYIAYVKDQNSYSPENGF